MCRGSDGSLYDAMCHLMDLRSNSGKFYLIQLVAKGDECYVFTRWGRLGESGAMAVCICFCVCCVSVSVSVSVSLCLCIRVCVSVFSRCSD